MPSTSHPGQLLDDERMVLSCLLAGEEEPFIGLRRQLESATVASRSEDTEGRVVQFALPEQVAPVAPLYFEVSDVVVDLGGPVATGFALVLVTRGVLHSLEIIADGATAPGASVTGVSHARLIAGEPDELEDERRVPVPERCWEPMRDQLRRQREADLAESDEAADLAGGSPTTEAILEELATRPQHTIAVPLLAPLAEVVQLFDAPAPGDAAGQSPPPERAADTHVGAIQGQGKLGLQVVLEIERMGDEEYALSQLGIEELDLPVVTVARAYKRWLAAQKPDLVLAAMLAARVTHRLPGGVIGYQARPLTRELFQYARACGVATWAAAAQHAREWWEAEGTSAVWLWMVVGERIGRWRAEREADAVIDEMLELRQELAAAQLPEQPGESARSPLRLVRDDDAAATQCTGVTAEEVEALRAELAGARAELEAARIKRSQQKERLDTQATELEEARAEARRQQKLARGMRNQLIEAQAAEADADDRSIDVPPEEGWPDDLLAGCTIMLFTGQERAAAREAMAEALRDVGAVVTVEECNSKGSVPDRFLDGVVVVTDIRFTGHAASDRIRAAAERSGVRLIEVKAGEGGIVRAVAGKLGAGRRLGGWSD